MNIGDSTDDQNETDLVTIEKRPGRRQPSFQERHLELHSLLRQRPHHAR
jgi:hypothetical protein